MPRELHKHRHNAVQRQLCDSNPEYGLSGITGRVGDGTRETHTGPQLQQQQHVTEVGHSGAEIRPVVPLRNYVPKKPTLRQLLEAVTVEQMLQKKQKEGAPTLIQIEEEATCLDAIKLMSQHNIGAIVVEADHQIQPVGIFTERDYIKKLILKGRSSHETLVQEVMTQHPIVVSTDFNLETCSALMANKEVRHLPAARFVGGHDWIDQDSQLVGMISARDVIEHMVTAAESASNIDLQNETIAQVFNSMGRESSPKCYIDQDHTVYEALQIMTEQGIGGVFAFKDNKLTGIFTERDYLHRMILQGRSSKKTRISEVMTRNVVTVNGRTTLHDCLSLMVDRQFRTLPVLSVTPGNYIDDSDRAGFVGMVTFMDVIKYLEALA